MPTALENALTALAPAKAHFSAPGTASNSDVLFAVNAVEQALRAMAAGDTEDPPAPEETAPAATVEEVKSEPEGPSLPLDDLPQAQVQA